MGTRGKTAKAGRVKKVEARPSQLAVRGSKPEAYRREKNAGVRSLDAENYSFLRARRTTQDIACWGTVLRGTGALKGT